MRLIPVLKAIGCPIFSVSERASTPPKKRSDFGLLSQNENYIYLPIHSFIVLVHSSGSKIWSYAAGDKGCGLLVKKGEIIRRVSEDALADSLIELIESEVGR